MNLQKQVRVSYQTSPVLPGPAFLFEVVQGDLPYGVYGRDCTRIAAAAGGGAVVFRRREANGELLPDGTDVNAELAALLKHGVPRFDEHDNRFLGDVDIRDARPRITGVAVEEANVAHRVAGLFKRTGYEVIKDW